MQLNIDPILKKKKISRSQLSQLAHIGYKATLNLCSGKTERVYLDTIEKICKALNCTPNDILTSDDPQMRRLLLLSNSQSSQSEDSESSNHVEGDSDK